MKKRTFLLALVLTALVFVGYAVAAGGDASDPLVSLDFLNGTFRRQAEERIDEAVTKADAGALDDAKARRNAAVAAAEAAVGSDYAAVFTEARVKQDDILSGITGLQGSPLAGELTTNDFNLYNEAGELKAMGYCYESFGIIVNTKLLADAGHSLDEIKDFASLKTVADDIHARAAELGFDAFSSAGLDGSSSWRFSGHLANMPLFYEFRDDNVTEQPATITGAYLENFKNIWDLYTTDTATTGAALATATGDESEAEFGEGKAAFYQNGTWEYSNLTGTFGMNPDDLAMIPIYCGVEGEEKAGLCAGTENCWAISNESSEEDIQATINFLVWVVTSDEGTTMLAEEFGPCPFKDAKEPENVFFQNANKYTAEGNYVVTWAFNWTPAVDDWRAAVVDALTQYTAGTGDWAAVETAFVQGWATQYAKENA